MAHEWIQHELLANGTEKEESHKGIPTVMNTKKLCRTNGTMDKIENPTSCPKQQKGKEI